MQTKKTEHSLASALSLLDPRTLLHQVPIFTNDVDFAKRKLKKWPSFLQLIAGSNFEHTALFSSSKVADKVRCSPKIRYGRLWIDFKPKPPLVSVKFTGISRDEDPTPFLRAIDRSFFEYEVDSLERNVIYAHFTIAPRLLVESSSSIIVAKKRVVVFEFTSKKVCSCKRIGHGKACCPFVKTMKSYYAPKTKEDHGMMDEDLFSSGDARSCSDGQQTPVNEEQMDFDSANEPDETNADHHSPSPSNESPILRRHGPVEPSTSTSSFSNLSNDLISNQQSKTKTSPQTPESVPLKYLLEDPQSKQPAFTFMPPEKPATSTTQIVKSSSNGNSPQSMKHNSNLSSFSSTFVSSPDSKSRPTRSKSVDQT